MTSRERIVAFLPCRSGSRRVKDKNTRAFADVSGGLTAIKVRHLLDCEAIDEVVISTDDATVKAIAESAINTKQKPLRILDRPDALARPESTTDELIAHVSDCIPQGTVLWTHVTSPFVDASWYSRAIAAYRDRTAAYDSLASATTLQKFVWDEKGPLNYDRSVEKWPATQTLPVWYELNSAIFIAPVSCYRELHDRIGRHPLFFPLPPLLALDIDWEEDFAAAEALWRLQGAT